MNGRDFDTMVKALGIMSDLNHKQHEINLLREKIARTKERCGSCAHWMIANQCPREAKGRIVNCNEWKCGKHEMQEWHRRFMADNEAKIAEIQLSIDCIKVINGL